ncbi:hypothetical protein BLOT_003062, partial [Blomia tropicalis]
SLNFAFKLCISMKNNPKNSLSERKKAIFYFKFLVFCLKLLLSFFLCHIHENNEIIANSTGLSTISTTKPQRPLSSLSTDDLPDLGTIKPSPLSPIATMAPRPQGPSNTLATNLINNIMGGGSSTNSNAADSNNTSRTRSSLSTSSPEVFIYDGATMFDSDESNSYSNVTSFFGNRLPNLPISTSTTGSTSSVTGIFNDENEADLNGIVSIGSPSSIPSSPMMCYSSPEDYELFTAMLCSSLVVLGVVYLTFGYRCFRAVAFFVGLFFGTALAYTVCTTEHLVEVEYGNLVVALVAGLLIGLLTMLVTYIGLFLIGFHLGLLSGVGLFTVIYLLRPYFDILQPPLSALTLSIFFVAIGLIGAFSTVYFSKGCTIIGSSVYGSALTLVCADYFVENFKLVHWFLDRLSNGDNWYGLLLTVERGQRLCLGSQIILALWPTLTLIGIVVQSCVTGRGVRLRNEYGIVESAPASMVLRSGHTDITSCHSSRSGYDSASMRGKSQEDLRLEQKHRKYRYLYQVRTAHGDVISQHYFQSMQNNKKLCLPEHDSYTLSEKVYSFGLLSNQPYN